MPLTGLDTTRVWFATSARSAAVKNVGVGVAGREVVLRECRWRP